MLSDDINPSRGSCNKDRRGSIGLFEFLLEFIISRSVISGVELIEVLIVDFEKHLCLQLNKIAMKSTLLELPAIRYMISINKFKL